MEREIRYGKAARQRDLFWAVLLSGVPASLAFGLLKKAWDFTENWHLLALWLSTAAAAVWLTGLWRWRIRGRLDANGISVQSAEDEPADEMAWIEVEEIFLGPRDAFEVRGAGRSLRIPPDVEDGRSLRADMRRHAEPIVRARLRGRWNEGAPLSFRGPGSAASSWACWILCLLALAAFAANCLRALREPEGGWSAAGAVGFVMLLWFAALRQAMEWISWRSAELVLDPDGVRLRRLGRSLRIPRSEIRDVRDQGGWLELVPRKGRRIRIPPLLGNFGFLAELLRTGGISG